MVSLRGFLSIWAASSLLTGVSAGCGTDNCLQIVQQYPWLDCEVSTFCEDFIHSTPHTKTVTRTATAHATATVPGAPVPTTTFTTTTSIPHPVSASTTVTVTVTPSLILTSSNTTTIVSQNGSTPAPITVTATTPLTVSVTTDLVCTSTVTTAFSTFATTSLVGYVAQPYNQPKRRWLDEDSQPAEPLDNALVPRDQSSIANLCNQGCDGRRDPFNVRLSSACKCFLTTPTDYKTATVTQTATATAKAKTTVVVITKTNTATAMTTTVTLNATTTLSARVSTSVNTIISTTIEPVAPGTVTVTVPSSVSVTASTCTSTTTTTVYSGVGADAVTCGAQTFTQVPAASTAGQVTCADPYPTPSLQAYFRIEGLQSGQGTIYENCILSGPRNVTTPSGGTHECDGTNDGANPAPGTTPTDLIDAAARQQGFSYDGTYESQYQDFFITSISSTSQGGNDYWGVMDNLVFTPTGGCQYEADPGDTVEWIFNAFNYNNFLSVSPGFAAAQAGQGSVTVTVSTTDGNGGGTSPFGGATFDGQTSPSNGQVVVNVPSSPGCYQYKALQGSSSPSNAFFLAVFPDGTFN